jgi:Transposase DDE domain
VHRHGGRARRWVVERTHSWLNRSRRLLVRWEKKAENYLAFIQLACAQLIFFKITVWTCPGTIDTFSSRSFSIYQPNLLVPSRA